MTTRSRLLILTPTAALRGGVERIIESLATGLPVHGIDVVAGLAAGRHHDTKRYRTEYPTLQAVDFESKTSTREGRVRAVMEVIQRVNPTLVLNARIYDSYEAVARLKVAGRRQFRFLTTIQAAEGDYVADLRKWRDVVDGCVTSGKLLARGVGEVAGFPAERVKSIAGGVRPAVRERAARSAGQPIRLGYVGRLEENQKRISDLIRLGDALRSRGVSFTLTIAGSGPAESDLRKRLEESEWAGSVTFLGWRSVEELYSSVYTKLDILVHFAAFEGITIAPREAMAHGVVPVISNFPGLRAEGVFIDGENARTFSVGDVARAVDLVIELAGDANELARLSRGAASSEQGERSESGAIREWAAFIRHIESLPARVPSFLPDEPRIQSGRLDRFLPRGIAEHLRALRGKKHSTIDPGSEWPHSGNHISRDEASAIESSIRNLESPSD